jgi:hypothetical protein
MFKFNSTIARHYLQYATKSKIYQVSYIGLDNDFLYLTTKAHTTKAVVHKWGCTANEIVNRVKKQPMDWEKIFANHHISYKELISSIDRELKTHSKKQITQFKN